MGKRDERQIRPIKYPKPGLDSRQGSAYRTSVEIAAMNNPPAQPEETPQQSAFFNRYFNGG